MSQLQKLFLAGIVIVLALAIALSIFAPAMKPAEHCTRVDNKWSCPHELG